MSFLGVDIIVDDPPVIESQRDVDPLGIEKPRFPGVVAGPRDPPGPGDEDRRHGVEAGVPVRVRIGVELTEVFDLERDLLPGLPPGGLLERLPIVDEPARQGPARRRVLPFDEDDPRGLAAAGHLDDDVHGGHGIPELSMVLHVAGRTRLL